MTSNMQQPDRHMSAHDADDWRDAGGGVDGGDSPPLPTDPRALLERVESQFRQALQNAPERGLWYAVNAVSYGDPMSATVYAQAWSTHTAKCLAATTVNRQNLVAVAVMVGAVSGSPGSVGAMLDGMRVNADAAREAATYSGAKVLDWLLATMEHAVKQDDTPPPPFPHVARRPG